MCVDIQRYCSKDISIGNSVQRLGVCAVEIARAINKDGEQLMLPLVNFVAQG